MSLSDDKAPHPSSHVEAVRQRIRGTGRRLWDLTDGVRAKLVPYWEVLTTPSRTFSLGFLTLGGFLAGIVFWGGFNTVVEATNTEKFCVSCHEMHDNVFEELKSTIHYSNRSGARATCPDCHVPHNWTNKMARKMQASKEVWGWLFGTISTREKFLSSRHVLAAHEWERLKANDSLECRNCHSAESMDISRQSQRAANAHQRFLFTGQKTCIDCHKGIAHRLPKGAYDFGVTGEMPSGSEFEALRAFLEKPKSGS
jgi:cytochrome c-type protein NapC